MNFFKVKNSDLYTPHLMNKTFSNSLIIHQVKTKENHNPDEGLDIWLYQLS